MIILGAETNVCAAVQQQHACFTVSFILTGEKVRVIGSSLSAIEVALTLPSDGLFARQQSGELYFIPSSSPGKITFYSRNGRLPRVGGRIGARPNLHLTCSNILQLILDNPCRVSLLSVFGLLDRELTAAYGSCPKWRQILSPSGDAVQIQRQDTQDARKGDGPDGAPETHQVIHPGANRLNSTCFPLFAIGAMTRGQTIDASMAYGIARSTAAVAEGVLSRVPAGDHRGNSKIYGVLHSRFQA